MKVAAKTQKGPTRDPGTMRMEIADISVNGRVRRESGDVAGLAASIANVGLLHPVVVDGDGRLVAGVRRLLAVQSLGWTEVPVTIAEGLDDVLSVLRAERDENTCRKPLLPSECVAMAKRLEPLERAAAKERQRNHGRTAPGQKKNTSEKFTEVNGESRSKVAAAVGMSAPTLKRATEIVEAAQADPSFAPLVVEMDRTNRVSGVHRKLKVARQAAAIEADAPALPTGPFRVIVIDPPWSYDKRAHDPSRRGVCPYPCMTIDAITSLPVRDLSEQDCVLWMWVTNSHLRDAFDIVESWDFTYKTLLTWVKPTMGTGDWLRGQSEHCLLCARGKPVIRMRNQTTVLPAPRGQHSQKPDEFYVLVEAMCPGSKLEMFQRTKREGWVGYGDECVATRP